VEASVPSNPPGGTRALSETKAAQASPASESLVVVQAAPVAAGVEVRAWWWSWSWWFVVVLGRAAELRERLRMRANAI
jgi:hypothetical protein